jgi:hypothetical protein
MTVRTAEIINTVIITIIIGLGLLVGFYFAQPFIQVYKQETKMLANAGMRRHNVPKVTVTILGENPKTFIVDEYRCHVLNTGISILRNGTWTKYNQDYSVHSTYKY